MIDCPATTLASLVGASNGAISRYFCGSSAGFTPHTVRTIEETLSQMERLTELAGVIPIDFSKPGRIKEQWPVGVVMKAKRGEENDESHIRNFAGRL